ncbi:MAG: prepilin peptidase [Acidimicrobiales bacterium]
MDGDLERWILAGFAGLLGLAIGSFITVVTWRVPRGESIVAPGSRCPSCATPLAWRDNLPVFSWVILAGRCRFCAARIGVRYPAMEVACGLGFAVATAGLGLVPGLGPALVAVSVAVGSLAWVLERPGRQKAASDPSS